MPLAFPSPNSLPFTDVVLPLSGPEMQPGQLYRTVPRHGADRVSQPRSEPAPGVVFTPKREV